MTQLYLSPAGLLLQQLSNLGIPLSGGQVFIKQAGAIVALQDSYSDSTGTTLNANPILLNAAGRMANSNAPISIWVPSSTPHRFELYDAAGSFLSGGASLDNLYGINDPFAVLSTLATPATAGTAGGASLVANAVVSYDVIASLRAAAAPSLVSGQTLVVDVEGGSLINDGNGGLFYWSSTSTATDDGNSVIKPASILSANPGRYLRQTNLFGTQGSFTLTGIGFTTNPTMQCQYVQNGNQVTVSYAGMQGVSNSGSFGLSGFPVALRGIANATVTPLMAAQDNNVLGNTAYWTIPNQVGGNVVVTQNSPNGLWTSINTKGLLGGSFSYAAS